MNHYYLMPLIVLPLLLSQNVVAGPNTRPQPGRHPQFIKLFDTNGDGQVTEEEFNSAMQQRYQEMDTDKDDSVSVEEFKKHAIARHKQWQHNRYDKMDRDRNGEVSKQEFIDQAVKRAEQRFSKMDKNQDGVLSEDENFPRNKMKKRQLLQKMDKNKDGRISPEEHAEMAQRWFAKLDANGDKVISNDELKGSWQQRRK